MRPIMQGLLLVSLLFSSGCGEEWAPFGTYELIQVWKDGDCGLMSSRLFTLTLRPSDSPDTEGIIATEPAGTLSNIQGAVTNGECFFSFTLFQSAGDFFPGETFSNFTFVERDDDITGRGNIVVGAPDNCAQDFEIEGSRTE